MSHVSLLACIRQGHCPQDAGQFYATLGAATPAFYDDCEGMLGIEQVAVEY